MTKNAGQQTTTGFTWRSYLSPKYWPTLFGFICFWLLSRLPLDWQLAIGRALGSLLYYAIPTRRKITATNLSFAFPTKTPAQLSTLSKNVYRNIGMAAAETASLWFRPWSLFAPRVQIKGAQILDEALASGQGVILLQAHFSTIELCGAAMGSRWPISAVYDSPKNPLYAAYLLHQRGRHLVELIENRDIRRMVKRLRQGGIVWFSPDQAVARARGGIETTYFDQPVLTSSGTARIQAMTNATVLPFVPRRAKNGGAYLLEIFPPVTINSEDVQSATQEINHLFESQIIEQAEQYFWVHKRFKPPNEAVRNPYA